ncbi:hypothetical protein KKG83_03700 [Candidatus Micrarchaeota archaeon]|nr:hypothetical protein [Candidatus Micrarchaeota archaeon]MBU2476549.1 hypothetical protein [Candidatus Micrarchaeota archaeon]
MPIKRSKGPAKRRKLTGTQKRKLIKKQMTEFKNKSKVVGRHLVKRGLAKVNHEGKLELTRKGKEQMHTIPYGSAALLINKLHYTGNLKDKLTMLHELVGEPFNQPQITTKTVTKYVQDYDLMVTGLPKGDQYPVKKEVLKERIYFRSSGWVWLNGRKAINFLKKELLRPDTKGEYKEAVKLALEMHRQKLKYGEYRSYDESPKVSGDGRGGF